MRVVDLIQRQRDGEEPAPGEIEALVRGYVAGDVADYQMAAWLMAVCWRGLSPRATADLTLALAHSGQTLDLGELGRRAVDKHSTGGVGDKATLVVAPLVAAAGAPVAKLSGRGLGFTGGTLDKLEAFPGFRTTLDAAEFRARLARHGIVVAGQSADLAPGDGKLYALRDVTATVHSVPLIASSVMSKKLAAGAAAIVLDVKAGRGAFMRTPAEAVALAEAMVDIGRGAGRRVAAVVSDMGQPLGLAVGNALEVREAIAALAGEGPPDLIALCRELGALMLLAAGAAPTPEAARTRLEAAWASGAGLAKLSELVAAQGGDARCVERPDLLPAAPVVAPVVAPRAGFVRSIDARAVGLIVGELGAGRQRKGEPVDLAVGVVLAAKVGAEVEAGAPLAAVHARTEAAARAAAARLAGAIEVGPERPAAPPLIHATIGPESRA